MTRIYIYGYESFEAWRDAGYPGAVSFNAPRQVLPTKSTEAVRRVPLWEKFCPSCGKRVHSEHERCYACRTATVKVSA
jgi:uncharacterized OB-fold protein